MFGLRSIPRSPAVDDTPHNAWLGLGLGPSRSVQTRAMAYKSNVLVVANRTALSIGLEAALRARLESGPASFTLLVPLGRTRDTEQTARNMAAHLCEAGFDVRGRAGDTDPSWPWSRSGARPTSTNHRLDASASSSRWMRADLMQRIERHTGALVRHVEAREQLTPLLDRRLAGSRVVSAPASFMLLRVELP